MEWVIRWKDLFLCTLIHFLNLIHVHFSLLWLVSCPDPQYRVWGQDYNVINITFSCCIPYPHLQQHRYLNVARAHVDDVIVYGLLIMVVDVTRVSLQILRNHNDRPCNHAYINLWLGWQFFQVMASWLATSKCIIYGHVKPPKNNGFQVHALFRVVTLL